MKEPNWHEEQRHHLFATWTAQAQARMFEIDDARGARFHVPGHGWMWDLESQVYNVSVGHRHPHVQRRMIEQIERLPAAAPNVLLPIRLELARMLAERTGLARSFLTTGGSEAVENAVKIARLVTGRSKIITRKHSYHGATLAMLEMGGDARRDPFAGTWPQRLYIEDPYPSTSDSGGHSDWVRSLTQILDRERPESIAAILLEGFTGTNGMQLPPDDFWPTVRRYCDDHGILLIDDEIFAGFGRTGRWFAYEHWGVRPDVLVVGKGITAGYAPMAGVVVSEAVARHFDDETLWCGLTSYAHPVGCAAAVATLEVLDHEGLVSNAADVGRRLKAGLGALQQAYEPVRDVRGLGLMLLVEFDRPAAPLSRLLFDRGVHAATRGPHLFVCPPLCLKADEADQVVVILDQAFAEFLRP